ncbi:N-acetylmuramoyl-L-alanine amidase [Clostridiaceae bacterium 35-E11]
MRVHSRKKYLAMRRRFHRRLFTLTAFIILISVFLFIKCAPNYIFTICIDAGHGGYDPGATNPIYKVKEKDLALDVSLKLGAILKKQNIKVIYTRKKDKIPWKNQIASLKGRSQISNKSNADIFVSIHANNFVESSEVRGTEVWCRFKNTEDEMLAREISTRLSSIGYTKDRGLKYEEDKALYVLRNTQSISVLVELGYLSNPQDLEFLISEKGKNQCAKAIAEGILNYYHSRKEEA